MRIPGIAFRVGGVGGGTGQAGSGYGGAGQVAQGAQVICRGVLACLVVLQMGAGCQKKSDATRAAGIAANPAAAAAAAPTTAPVAPTAAPVPSPATGPTPPSPSSPPGAANSGGTILGKITLAPSRKANVTPNDVVYLVARRVPDSAGVRGSLIAVKRYTASSFPIEFTLGAADMMFKNGAFEGDLTLAARVDKDGDPMTRKKGDVFGTLDRVRVGSTGVELKLDQLQKEDESLAGAPTAPAGMPAGHP